MKKVFFAVIAFVIVGLLGIAAYRLGAPEVVVVNESGSSIQEVTVHLPANRVVFGRIEAGERSRIYYTIRQQEGAYRYRINAAGAEAISGACGRVDDWEIGKRLRLVLLPHQAVRCEEGSKIF